MAFGKDPSLVKRVNSFREQAYASQPTRAPRTGSGGLRWANRFQPSTVDEEKIRFLRGDYKYERAINKDTSETYLLDYFRFAEHFDGKTKTSTICSAGTFAGFKGKSDPCLGCDLFWENPKKGGRMSRRELYSFTILNYATFHHVEQVDKQTGAARINDKTGKPFMQWVQCTGRRCDMCAAGKETKKGHIQHYEMGMGHFGQLSEYANLIGRSCRSCKQRDVIQPVAYLCQGCKNAVIDMNETSLSSKDIKEMIEKAVTCPFCKYTDLLEEIIECTACGDPKRADIFDVDISFKRAQGEGNQTSLLFTGYGPITPIDAAYTEMAKPLDLAKLYVPDALEVQAEKFKENIPQGEARTSAALQRQPVPASQVSRPYGASTPEAAPQGAVTPRPVRGAGYTPPPPQEAQSAPTGAPTSMFRR